MDYPSHIAILVLTPRLIIYLLEQRKEKYTTKVFSISYTENNCLLFERPRIDFRLATLPTLYSRVRLHRGLFAAKFIRNPFEQCRRKRGQESRRKIAEKEERRKTEGKG